MKKFTEDLCDRGVPLRDHDAPACCDEGCNFTDAVFDQAVRDEEAGIGIYERLAYEARRQVQSKRK